MKTKIIVLKRDETSGADWEIYNSDYQDVTDDTVSDLTEFIRAHLAAAEKPEPEKPA